MVMDADFMDESFQSTSLIRGKTMASSSSFSRFSFHSTSLIRGKTWKDEGWLTMSNTFQSTSLIRGKTRRDCASRPGGRFFNPLPSSEGRPSLFIKLRVGINFSIHFPHPREDGNTWTTIYTSSAFQSTSLIRGKT